MTTEGIGPTFKAIIKDTATIAAKPLKSAAKESLGFVAKLREGTRLGKLGNRIGTIAENLERELEPSPQTHLKEQIHKLTEQLSRALSSKFNMALVSLKIKQPITKVAPSAPKSEAKKAPQPPSTPSPRRVARQAASESSPVVAAPRSEARKKAILAAMKPTQAAREANREASAFYKNTRIGADLFKAMEDRALTREEADLIRQIYVTESARNQSDEAKAAAIKKSIGERIKTETDSEKEHALNELISNMDSYLEHPDLMPPPSNQT